MLGIRTFFKLWIGCLFCCPFFIHAQSQLSPKESLKALAEQSSSVESFLGKLAEKHPEHFQNYTSIYATRSLHRASFDFPRVVLIGKSFSEVNSYKAEPNFLLSFSTDPGDPRAENIEVAFWNPTLRQYEFVGIEFGLQAKSKRFKEEAFCESCHGYPAKPIWDSYFFWPGVFGSEDDSSTFRPYRTYPEYSKSKEFRYFLQFTDKINSARENKQGRLQHLKPLKENQRPNLALNRMIVRQAGEQYSQLIGGDTAVQKLRYLIWGAMTRISRCDNDFADFFPTSLRTELRSTLDLLEAEIREADTQSLLHRHKKYEAITGEKPSARANGFLKPSDYYHRNWAVMRFIFEGMLENPYDLLEWSTELSPKVWRISTLQYLGKAFAKEMQLEKIRPHEFCDVGLREHQKLNRGAEVRYSESFRQQVKRAIARFRKKSEGAQFKVFENCINCHSYQNKRNVPYIPFSDELFLQRRLRSSTRLKNEILLRISPSAEGQETQMPPGEAISSEARQKIQDYLIRFN